MRRRWLNVGQVLVLGNPTEEEEEEKIRRRSSACSQ
jgi:hypothetical protein